MKPRIVGRGGQACTSRERNPFMSRRRAAGSDVCGESKHLAFTVAASGGAKQSKEDDGDEEEDGKQTCFLLFKAVSSLTRFFQRHLSKGGFEAERDGLQQDASFDAVFLTIFFPLSGISYFFLGDRKTSASLRSVGKQNGRDSDRCLMNNLLIFIRPAG